MKFRFTKNMLSSAVCAAVCLISPSIQAAGVVLGSGATNGGTDGVAVGDSTSATGYYSVAIGSDATTSGGHAVVVGHGATAGSGSISIGGHSTAGVNSVGIGMSTSVGDNGTAIGVGSSTTGDGVALGSGVHAGAGEVAVGSRTLVGSGGMTMTGTVDFTGANVVGISTFDQNNAGALGNVGTLTGSGGNYAIDLIGGAATLDSVSTSTVTTGVVNTNIVTTGTVDAQVVQTNLIQAGSVSAATVSAHSGANIEGDTQINTHNGGTTTIGNITTLTGTGGTYSVNLGSGAATLDSVNSASVSTGTVGATTVNTGAINASSATISGGASVLGGTQINTSGSATTTIGNVTTLTGTGGSYSVNLGNGAATLDSVSSASVSTGTLSATTVNAGAINASSATVVGATQINATGTAATTIGNSGTASRVDLVGGSSSVSLTNAQASLTNGGNGLTVYQTTQTLTSGQSINDRLAGSQYVNKIQGDTLIDGNIYINGTMNYVSSNAATTQVNGKNELGTSVLTEATQGTAGQMTIVNAGSNGANESSASLTLQNGIGNTHGIEIFENRTVLTGGVHSTQMVMADDSVAFSNVETGAPVKVTGIADATGAFDAVNFRQLQAVQRQVNDVDKRASQGVAMASALAGIPQVEPGKRFSIGAGTGYFNGQGALSVGGSVRLAPAAVAKFGLGLTGQEKAVSAGFAASF